MSKTKKKPQKTKGKSKAKKALDYKVCNKCDIPNELLAKQCKSCGSKKFAPDWVKSKRSINRYTSVQVTTSNPEFGTAEDRVTLSKWWPGGSATFHIPNPDLWSRIKGAIDGDLASELKWLSKKDILKNIASGKAEDKSVTRELKKLATQYPDLLGDATKAIAQQAKKVESVDEAVELNKKLSEALKNASSGFKDAFVRLIDELPKQKLRAVEGLADALEKWSLHQIVSVAQEVRQRLDTIELFKERILDEKTYEIRGDNSIHRILERSMWMIDERYWLMHSNSTLRTIIGEKLEKKDKKFSKKRPDFVCGTIGSKLVLIELKRPSHTLEIEDLNQLETYLTIASEYSTEFKSSEAYLIGQSISPDLERRKKFRSSNFHVMTFTDLISDAEKRYKDYLKHYKALQED